MTQNAVTAETYAPIIAERWNSSEPKRDRDRAPSALMSRAANAAPIALSATRTGARFRISGVFALAAIAMSVQPLASTAAAAARSTPSATRLRALRRPRAMTRKPAKIRYALMTSRKSRNR